MSKKTTALVPVTEKPRRVVGRAVETNPMIAAIAQITPDKLDDIDEEIAVTENYLAGLKAMRHVGSIALGVGPKAAPVEVEVVPEDEPVEKENDEPPPQAPAPKPKQAPAPKPRDGVSVSGVVREIITANPDITTDAIIDEAIKRGVTGNKNSIRTTVYNVRSQLKTGGPKPAAPAKAPKAETEESEDDGSRKLPPKDSPHRAAAELTLRKEVAEYIFKKGLVPSGAIIRDCKVSPRIINEFMQHPWFESHMQQWRLTAAGKNEAIEM